MDRDRNRYFVVRPPKTLADGQKTIVAQLHRPHAVAREVPLAVHHLDGVREGFHGGPVDGIRERPGVAGRIVDGDGRAAPVRVRVGSKDFDLVGTGLQDGVVDVDVEVTRHQETTGVRPQGQRLEVPAVELIAQRGHAVRVGHVAEHVHPALGHAGRAEVLLRPVPHVDGRTVAAHAHTAEGPDNSQQAHQASHRVQ